MLSFIILSCEFLIDSCGLYTDIFQNRLHGTGATIIEWRKWTG